MSGYKWKQVSSLDRMTLTKNLKKGTEHHLYFPGIKKIRVIHFIDWHWRYNIFIKMFAKICQVLELKNRLLLNSYRLSWENYFLMEKENMHWTFPEITYSTPINEGANLIKNH